MINTKCPYCGNEHMTADVDIRITCDIKDGGKDAKLIVRPFWYDGKEELQEAVDTSSSEYVHGYCDECGSYCDFDWWKGFIG